MQSTNTTATSQLADSTVSVSRHHRSRRVHHRSASSYRCDARIRRYKYLLAGISTLFLLLFVLTLSHNARMSAEHKQELLELRKKEVAFNTMAGKLEIVRQELDALVQNRIPGLTPLKFDEAINVDDKYIRNIIFTLATNGKQRHYEYRIVMHNDTLSVIHPEVEILLFDEVGIQIGVAKVEYRDASAGTKHPALSPGEVRSYTSSIEVTRDVEPSYFLLEAADTKQVYAGMVSE